MDQIPQDLPPVTHPSVKLVPPSRTPEERKVEMEQADQAFKDALERLKGEMPLQPSSINLVKKGNHVPLGVDMPTAIPYKDQERYVRVRDKDKKTGKKEVGIPLSPPVTLDIGEVSPNYKEIKQKDGRYVLETIDGKNKVVLLADSVNIAYDGHEVRLDGPGGEPVNIFPHPDPVKAQTGVLYSPKNWVGAIKILTYEVRDSKNKTVSGVRIWEQVRQLDQSMGLTVRPVFRKQIITGEDGKVTDVQAFGVDRDYVGPDDATVEEIKNGYVVVEQQLFMGDENIPFAVLKIVQTAKVVRIVGIWQYDRNMVSAKN